MVSSASAETRRTQVRLRGTLVEVVRLGRGRPLVLVPGLAGSWQLLTPLAHRLSRHFEVIAYGLRGDGFAAPALSGPGLDVWDMSVHSDDLSSLIEQLRLECPVVFGISFGGAIALQFALDHPSRLSAMVLQGAAARFSTTLGSAIARRVLERFVLPHDNGFVNQFFNLLHGARPEPGPLVDFVTERIWETDQSVMASRLALLEHFDVTDRLWQIDVPTLVLAGSKDVIVPAAHQRRLADSIPGARFELLDGAGHIGFLTHRAETLHHVRDLLKGVKSSI
jgi:pimeloyl-ACP methyl ester carboxylesterase